MIWWPNASSVHRYTKNGMLKNLPLHVIDSICFSNIRNDKQSFMQKEYKTNPISTILCLQMIPSKKFPTCIVVSFYEICSGIFDSMFFSFFFSSSFSISLNHRTFLCWKCWKFGMYNEKLIIISENARVLQYSNSDELNDLPIFVRIWVLSIHGILHGSTCFRICIHKLLEYERNIWFENIYHRT